MAKTNEESTALRWNLLTGPQHFCPVCGKEFFARQDWTFRIRRQYHPVYLCSWTCLRIMQKEIETERLLKRERRKRERAAARDQEKNVSGCEARE